MFITGGNIFYDIRFKCLNFIRNSWHTSIKFVVLICKCISNVWTSSETIHTAWDNFFNVSSFFNSINKSLLLPSAIEVTIKDLRNLSESRLWSSTARWYLARVFRIMVARAPAGGLPASFHTRCQKSESSHSGRLCSFHMGTHQRGGARFGNAWALASRHVLINCSD